jgi:DNA-binding PadR family transcriptional regulator
MLLKRTHENGEKITERHVKAFLDLLILGILNGRSMYGYMIIAAVHKEFGFLLSPGSLYPLLHMLEEKKLISSIPQRGKIVYSTTSIGKQMYQSISAEYKATIQQMDNFMKYSATNPSQGL